MADERDGERRLGELLDQPGKTERLLAILAMTPQQWRILDGEPGDDANDAALEGQAAQEDRLAGAAFFQALRDGTLLAPKPGMERKTP